MSGLHLPFLPSCLLFHHKSGWFTLFLKFPCYILPLPLGLNSSFTVRNDLLIPVNLTDTFWSLFKAQMHIPFSVKPFWISSAASLLLALKLWDYLLYLCDTPKPGLYNFGPYITASIELCSVIIPLAHTKNSVRNCPAQSTIEFTVWLLLGTWFATFHSVFSMLTHGKNVSQSTKPRIAGLSWAAVLFLSCGHHESCLPLFIGLEPKLQPTTRNK